MIYVGLDVHQKSTTICIQDEKGKQCLLESCPTTFEGFQNKLGAWLSNHPGAPVGMESCSKAYVVSGIVAALGGTPRVFSADEAARKTRSKKKKTDGRDAQDLCTNLRTGALTREVRLPPEAMRKLRSVLRASVAGENSGASDQCRQSLVEGVRSGGGDGEHDHRGGLEKASFAADAGLDAYCASSAFLLFSIGPAAER